jgi:hypothetical protein
MRTDPMQNPENVRAVALLQKVSVVTGLTMFMAIPASYASADYGPAIWNPPCNANYNTTGSGHKFHVIHDMEGYYAGVISMFKGCGYTAASVHYLVNGKKDATSDAAPGEITQMIQDANYAWHARCWNTHCTGTEHEGFASNPAWYTPELYSASAGVTRNLAAKFGWAKDRNHVIAHGQKSVAGWSAWASANLGIDPNCNTHTDPGPYWDWTGYMNLVNNGTPASWSAWDSLGGGFTSGFGSCTRGVNRLDVFGVGANSAVYMNAWNGATWSGWISLNSPPGGATSDPEAVCWGGDRIDVFVRGTDNAIWSMNWNGSQWSGWYSLGGGFLYGPGACSRGVNALDVFGVGLNNNMYINVWNGSTWSGWANIGGVHTSDPSAVSWGNGRIDVCARGTDNGMWTQSWSGSAWSGWSSLGGGHLGGPSVSSQGVNRLDVFAIGSGNNVYQKIWNGTSWTGWANLGGSSLSDPSSVSWSANRIDLFVRGTDNACWHRAYR